MAVLIERSTTPVYANAMNVDTDANGVVDGFTSYVNSGITATFSLNDSAQKIEITASANAGNTGVYTGFITVSASTAYSLQVLLRGSITAGAPTLRVYLHWYDASNTFISTSSVSDTTITTYWEIIKLENVVSPANATKVVIELDIRAQVAGDTGAVWFRNVMLEQSTICSTFTTTTRAADNAYIDIAPLTGEWALAGAFALPYANTVVYPGYTISVIAELYKDTSNLFFLGYSASTDNFVFTKRIANTDTTLASASVTFNSYQIHKVIISQGNGGMHMFIRKNNGTTIEAHNTSTALISPSRLYVEHYTLASFANAFVESLTLYRNKAITTLAEADAIFDSMNAEMVTNGDFSNGSTGWMLASDVIVENGMLKDVANAAGGTNTWLATQNITVLPNNTYKIKVRLIGYVNSSNYPKLNVAQKDLLNYNFPASTIFLTPTTNDQIVEATITTSANTFFISLSPYAVGAGTFYWDDISVKLVN